MIKQTLNQTLALIKSDFIKRCEYEVKPYHTLQVLKFLIHPAAISTVIYRLQRFFFTHGLSSIASLLKNLNGIVFSVWIASDADIGERFLLLHSSYINIGAGVVAGSDLILVHQSGISASPIYASTDQEAFNHAPILGHHVVVGGGAMVTGGIVIGNHVKISMNAAVESSFDDDAVLFGVPARNVNKKDNDA